MIFKEYWVRQAGFWWMVIGAWIGGAIGCSQQITYVDALPIRAEQLDFKIGRSSISWVTRHELFVSRHQWDVFPLSEGSSTVQAYRGARTHDFSLVVGAEGIGAAFDWVLLRSNPPVGFVIEAVPIDVAYVPKPGESVAIVSRNMVPNQGPAGPLVRQSIGLIERVDLPCEDAGEQSPAGTVISVRLEIGRTYPGCSGSPAAVWDRESRRWVFLGIVVAGSSRADDHHTIVADGRTVTIVRPPAWVFDLLTPEQPGLTWPSEEAEEPAEASVPPAACDRRAPLS